jgi:hypothetical protein
MIPFQPGAGHRSLILGGLGALGCVGLALLSGEVGPMAARAGLAVLTLGAVVLLVRRRAVEAPPPRLRVVSRATLARDSAAVLVELDGRPMLLGVGRDGVRLLAGTGWLEPEVEP